MVWNYISIRKLQRLHSWSLGMGKQFLLTLYNGCNYSSIWDQSESMLVKGAQVISCSSVSKQCDLYRSNHFWEWHQTRAISIFLRLHWVHRGFSQLMNVRTWHRLLSVRKQNSWEYVLRILYWGCFRAFFISNNLHPFATVYILCYASCLRQQSSHWPKQNVRNGFQLHLH